MRRRGAVARRVRFFLGCEGESEQGYGALLQRLAEARGLHVHIVVRNLQPAGDPLSLIEKAIKAHALEARRGDIKSKALLLDADTLDDVPERGRRARAILTREGFTTIWQRPDHEALLLRHFEGRQHADPPREHTMAALLAEWPTYRKNMPAVDLQSVISLKHVLRAAQVVPGLRAFLAQIGLR